MEIETSHLRLVKVVADQGSITHAAAVLGMTQPALTRQLRRVKENLGGQLFERSRTGVVQMTYGDGTPLRYMDDPSKDGGSYSRWSSAVPNSDRITHLAWFAALTQYMTSTETYADARIDTVSAATDLYGAGSAEVQATEAAWSAVNVN